MHYIAEVGRARERTRARQLWWLATRIKQALVTSCSGDLAYLADIYTSLGLLAKALLENEDMVFLYSGDLQIYNVSGAPLFLEPFCLKDMDCLVSQRTKAMLVGSWHALAVRNNKLHMVVRAHKCVTDGFKPFAQSHLIILFSASAPDSWYASAVPNNELQMIVRAHECVMVTFERFAQGHLTTLLPPPSLTHGMRWLCRTTSCR